MTTTITPNIYLKSTHQQPTTTNTNDIENLFFLAFKENKFEVMKWLYEQNPTAINIHKNDEYVFCSICEMGNLEMAKWLVDKGKINISVNNDYAFRWACNNNHLEVAKLLVDKGKINISVNNEEPFVFACILGNLEIAKWLWSIKPTINVLARNYSAFECALKNGKMDVVNWLYEIYPKYRDFKIHF